MSGTTRNDGDPDEGHPATFEMSAEFEADVECASTNTAPVLITGTAEVAAALAVRIHKNSLNRRSAFLTVDCGRVQKPEQLETVFDTAEPRGTVFLRDVDRLPAALQALLFFRIVPLGVRVIASTSVSLLRATAQGKFDERLFYRLNQIHLFADPPTGAA